MTYYLKYRPKTLDELDIKSVRESLKKIISSKNMPHAFLFCGPKGIGKTSAARILAAIINCESDSSAARGPGKINPCNKCDSCLTIAKGTNMDVIELDAASHRGIDDAKILRDAVKLSPARAFKKVYIIDEAHMLTPEASNALLKTLEEPPSHVVFILATTNPEKLIDTIRSITVTIAFNKATKEEIVGSLKKIIKGEKIKIEDKSLDLIADYSEGSFRDASKILEQIVFEKLSKNNLEIEKYLNLTLSSNINKLFDYIIKNKLTEALEEVDKIIGKGSSAESVIQKLIERLKTALLAKISKGEDFTSDLSKDRIIYLIELLIKANKDVKNAYIEELPLEIAIIKFCENIKDSKRATSNEEEEKNDEKRDFDKIKQKVVDRGKTVASDIKKISADTKEISQDIWDKILEQIKPINMSVEALLRAAKPVKFDGKILTLGVYYRFHKERLEDIRNKQILENVVEQVLSIPAKVVCILTEAPAKKIIKEEKSDVLLTESKEEDVVKAAKEIFGS